MPLNSESDSSLSSKTTKRLNFYEILGVAPQATQSQIRDAYRRKSKQYHPDTTSIEKSIAAQKFQSVNQAYDTLRFVDKRAAYDLQLRKIQSLKAVSAVKPRVTTKTTSAFLDPEDRPLSPGEIFALFILGVTFLFCLLVALFLGVSRGEMLFSSLPAESSLIHQLDSVSSPATPGDTQLSASISESKTQVPGGTQQQKTGSKNFTARKTGAAKADSPRVKPNSQSKQQLSLFPGTINSSSD